MPWAASRHRYRLFCIFDWMLTCPRLQCEAVDLLAVHPFRAPHARRQLEAEVAQQLCHAGIVHNSGQRLPNALPRPCRNQSWISFLPSFAWLLLALHGRSRCRFTCVTSHGARLLCLSYCLSCNEGPSLHWVLWRADCTSTLCWSRVAHTRRGCSLAGCVTRPVKVKRGLLFVGFNQQAASI